MQINLLGEEWHVSEDTSPSELVNDIRTKLDASDLHIHYFKADGIEIYADILDYLEEEMGQIRMLEIITAPYNVLVYQAVVSLQRYLERALPEIKVLANSFYFELSSESWRNFGLMTEGLDWIASVLNSFNQSAVKYADLPQYEVISNRLKIIIDQLNEALNDENNTLIADLLKYELVPLLIELKAIVYKTITTEVPIDDPN